MLQNARVKAFFTVFELLRENQQGGGGVKLSPSPPRLGLNVRTRVLFDEVSVLIISVDKPYIFMIKFFLMGVL